jgi:hypothetical protein
MGKRIAEFITLKPEFSWLNKAFDSLAKVIDEYVYWEEESPFCNNETASVSLLVAAGARSGYIMLAEYRTDKKGPDRKRQNGRCDLFVDRRNRRKQRPALEIEAKQMYRVRPTILGMKKELQKACKDSKRLPRPKGQHEYARRAGLLFVMLSHSEKNASKFDVAEFKRRLEVVPADLCWLWYDPDCDEIYRLKENKQYYRGCAVLLKA